MNKLKLRWIAMMVAMFAWVGCSDDGSGAAGMSGSGGGGGAITCEEAGVDPDAVCSGELCDENPLEKQECITFLCDDCIEVNVPDVIDRCIALAEQQCDIPSE